MGGKNARAHETEGREVELGRYNIKGGRGGPFGPGKSAEELQKTDDGGNRPLQGGKKKKPKKKKNTKTIFKGGGTLQKQKPTIHEKKKTKIAPTPGAKKKTAHTKKKKKRADLYFLFLLEGFRKGGNTFKTAVTVKTRSKTP